MKHKKLAITFIGAVLVLAIAVALSWRANKAEAVAVQYLSNCYFIASSTSTPLGVAQFRTSTTSVQWLTTTLATSSTAMVCNVKDGDRADLNLQFSASSSASVLHWSYEVANPSNTALDCKEFPAQCDWFGETTATVVDNLGTVHGPATTTHSLPSGIGWGQAGSPTTTANVTIDPITSRWLRISFWVSGAGGNVWAQLVGRESR